MTLAFGHRMELARWVLTVMMPVQLIDELDGFGGGPASPENVQSIRAVPLCLPD